MRRMSSSRLQLMRAPYCACSTHVGNHNPRSLQRMRAGLQV